MFDAGMLTLLSLVLGLAAWVLPLVRLARLKRTTSLHGLHRTCFVSFSCCALALVCELFFLDHRVVVQDWSALMDTMRAVCMAAAVLLAGTVLVNLPLLLFSLDEKKEAAEASPAPQIPDS